MEAVRVLQRRAVEAQLAQPHPYAFVYLWPRWKADAARTAPMNAAREEKGAAMMEKGLMDCSQRREF